LVISKNGDCEVIIRILQVVDLLLLVPMFCLGVMVGLSGGGLNPVLGHISGWLLFSPLVGIAGVVAAEVLRRYEQPTLAVIAAVIPLLLWIGLLIWLQRDTGFFF
jgi:hypothetical protein